MKDVVKFYPDMLVAEAEKNHRGELVRVYRVLRVTSVNDKHVRTLHGTFRVLTGQSTDRACYDHFILPLTEELLQKAEYDCVVLKAHVLLGSKAEFRVDSDASYQEALRLSEQLGRPLNLTEMPSVYVVEVCDRKVAEFTSRVEAHAFTVGYNTARSLP